LVNRPGPTPATPKTSHAAMTVRQPLAQPALSPWMAWGKAAGRSTSLNMLQPRRPRFCPTSRRVGLTFLKPSLRSVAMGKTTAQTATRITASVPASKSRTSSGKTAMAGMGPSARASSVSRSFPTLVLMAKTARKAASNAPMSIAVASTPRAVHVAEARRPETQPSQKAPATSSGFGNRVWSTNVT
jgi:hypothetical protein